MRELTTKKRVRVVIVTYNAAGIIRGCLNSLYDDFKQGLIEVVVADNNSSDSTAEIITSEFNWVELRRSSRNGGFGAGNNLGSVGCQTDYLYFLNSDARTVPRAIDNLMRLLDKDERIGIVSPLIVDEDGHNTLSTYRFITPLYAIWIAIGLNRMLPLNRTNNRHEIRRAPPDGRVRVDRVLGAAFMMRRDLFDRLDGFDENYFLYSEEEDLCLRAQKLGYQIVFDPNSRAIHLGSKTILPFSVLSTASASWSLKYFLQKHYNGFLPNLAIAIWALMLMVKWLLALLFILPNRRKRLIGYATAIRSLITQGYYNKYVRPK